MIDISMETQDSCLRFFQVIITMVFLRKLRLLSDINGCGLRSHPYILDHNADNMLM